MKTSYFNRGAFLLNVMFTFNYCAMIYFSILYYLDIQGIIRATETDKFMASVFMCAVIATLAMKCFFLGYAEQWVESQRSIKEPSPFKFYEVVYILRRSDNILKIGRTANLVNRIEGHRKDYGTEFDIVTSWVVPNSIACEAMALDMTRCYTYTEGNRKELRCMTDKELSDFILAFTRKLQEDFGRKNQ